MLWCEGLWCESVCMRLWVRGIAGGQPGVMLRSGGGVVAGAGDESGVGVEADEGEAAVGCYVDLRGGVGNGETGKEEGWDAVTVNVIV